jgi:PAS domain-containing protein
VSAQQPLELILARNLLSALSTPGALVGEEGRLLFFNEAAGAILGRNFEDSTGLTADAWTSEFGPVDDDGAHIPYEQLDAIQVVRSKHPFHGDYAIRTNSGIRNIEVSAIPIAGEGAGAIILFWLSDVQPDSPTTANAAGSGR